MSDTHDPRPKAMVVNDWESHRKKILSRDGYECVFCGMDDDLHTRAFGRGLHIHHIIPRREYGTDSKENLMTVCTQCHRKIEAISDHLLDERRDVESEYMNDLPPKNKVAQALNKLGEAIHDMDGGTEALENVRAELLGTVQEWDDE